MNPLITLYYNKHIQGARRKNMLMEGVWWGDAKITDFNQKKKERKNYRLSCSLFYIKWLLKLGYETAPKGLWYVEGWVFSCWCYLNR